MKTRRILVAFVFMIGIGSAVASEYFIPVPAWTRKVDVPAQGANCVQRSECNGSIQECKVNIDHDGQPGTLPIDVQLYNSTCATPLFKD